uniref:Uncharacterized protein n=1 Tax=viral metagenome TaxID=1070528 RepID=A0A6C0CIK8_9ZZZZ
MLEVIKKYLNLTYIGLALNAASILASFITMIYFSVMLSRLSDYDYVYNYKPRTCTPQFGTVVIIPCGDNGAKLLPQKVKYIAMFSTSEMFTMIEDPFSARDSYDKATQDVASYVLDVPYDCYCRELDQKVPPPSQDACQLWSQCISETDFIQYIQRDNGHYKTTYVAFILSSLVSIVFSSLAIGVAIKLLRRKPSGEEYPLFSSDQLLA